MSLTWKQVVRIESIHFTHARSLTKGVRSRSIPHSNQSNAWPCSNLAGKLNSSPYSMCACCAFEWFEQSIEFLSKWPLIRNTDRPTLYTTHMGFLTMHTKASYSYYSQQELSPLPLKKQTKYNKTKTRQKQTICYRFIRLTKSYSN